MQNTITLSQSLPRQGGLLRDEICDDRSPGLVGRGLYDAITDLFIRLKCQGMRSITYCYEILRAYE